MKEFLNFAKTFHQLWSDTLELIDKNGTLDAIIEYLEANQQPISSTNYKLINKTWGIYVFYIEPDCEFTYDMLCKSWNQDGYDKYPKTSKTRFLKSINENKLHYTFYLGKTENIAKRIEEHITHKDKHPTYSLKLNGRLSFNQNILCSYWELPFEFEKFPKEVKQFLITQLESKLRNKLNPWIGKQ
jgi:hypothetical protein